MQIGTQKHKVSFEGEGVRLGLKTLFFKYPGDDMLDITPYGNIYINTDRLDGDLYNFCKFWSLQGRHITIETPRITIGENWFNIDNILFFITINTEENLPLKDNLFIKIRVLEEKDLDKMIILANNLSLNHPRRVMLMPEYKCDYAKLFDKADKINSLVRYMPPVQDIIKIP